MKKVFILVCDWVADYENGVDFIDAFESKDSAVKALKDFVKNEKETTWISDYLEDMDFDEYEETEDTFRAYAKDYRYCTDVYIVEKTTKK